MGQKTGIEWADSTWNPVTGCTRVSSGCDNCYAATLAGRLLRDIYRARLPVVDTDITRRDPFAVRLWPERLSQPLDWPDARMIFVNSMSDAFHADIPDDFVRSMFEGAPFRVYRTRGARAASLTRAGTASSATGPG
jgi:protein gp37